MYNIVSGYINNESKDNISAPRLGWKIHDTNEPIRQERGKQTAQDIVSIYHL